MPIQKDLGAGKYDVPAQIIAEATEAECVLVIVLGGKRGNGFSVCARQPAVITQEIPGILRDVADQIEHATEMSAKSAEN